MDHPDIDIIQLGTGVAIAVVTTDRGHDITLRKFPLHPDTWFASFDVSPLSDIQLSKLLDAGQDSGLTLDLELGFHVRLHRPSIEEALAAMESCLKGLD